MARFSGSGDFTLLGSGAKCYDMEMTGSGAVTLAGSIENCQITRDLTLNANAEMYNSNVSQVTASGNSIRMEGIEATDVIITGDMCSFDGVIENSTADALTITGSQNQVRGLITDANQHGVVIEGDRNIVEMMVENCGSDADDTYDCVHIQGASDRNFINGSMFIPRTAGNQTRSAVNIGGTGECNMVVGNDLGDPDDYGTDAIIDTANNTQLFWPADATYGDNYVDCGSGS